MADSGVEFKSHSKEAKARLQTSIAAALEAGSLIIEGQVKANLTASGYVDTGELRDSFSHQISDMGKDTKSKIGTPLKRAVYPEYGTGDFAENGAGRKGGWSYLDSEGKWHYTKGQKPLKFMRKAFRSKKGEVKEVMKSELRKGMQ
ncbi:HK97-gp10 family putative phage morphogenesis protein [Lactococcus formosensis]|uniref:HK97-gp10 family putative phage morphogenesis protein n=1 Tax=Lactococcus formosensis TaxID=1281486 RepID=UPI00254A76D3|nr:HK97-gp10 family putative phage morphogenesis protein [Lactococcus formosensis]